MAGDAIELIETATRRFLDEVPALKPMKLVVAVELRGRGDTQHFRLQLPEVQVTKDTPSDAKVRVEMPRAFFNELAKDGKVADWREAFQYGQAKASGPTQILQLIERVVDKQEERTRLRRAAERAAQRCSDASERVDRAREELENAEDAADDAQAAFDEARAKAAEAEARVVELGGT